MICAEKGKEQDSFTAFVEYALGILAKEDYASFLSLFDSSRLTEQDLILALKYLDETRPILKIDDPILTKSTYQDMLLIPFRDGSGYHMDYDLTTAGERNDLTIQIEFLKEADGYLAVLDDLHTL
ncbi:MAG: hypothetical protein HDR08_02525 [Lachnospiraceae bacterium]|nr:hypothetical protein [Lachnospiraceae bacterium]